MWIYQISTGLLTSNRIAISRGYSGKGRGKNNPALQNMRGIGPLPVGLWRMVRVYDSASVGPFTIELHAVDALPHNDWHEPTGRGHFRIHGDSIRRPGTASKGCLIFPRAIRQSLWAEAKRGGENALIRVIP